MSRFVLLAAVLCAAAPQLTAATRIQISSRLVGYDLQQAIGSSSPVTQLPDVTVRSGSEALVEVAKEYRYPKEFSAKGRVTVYRIAHLGIRMPIYVREDGDKLKFIMRVELSEREDPNNPLSAVLKTTTSFQGQAQFDRQLAINVGAPGGRTATLELTMSRR
jgi:hypothetical protein